MRFRFGAGLDPRGAKQALLHVVSLSTHRNLRAVVGLGTVFRWMPSSSGLWRSKADLRGGIRYQEESE
jgi:hypothetical protein